MKYQLYREQQLNCDIETAWYFFSSPDNLSKITPNDLRFKILTEITDYHITDGMIIDYHVSPIFRVPLKWRTRIVQLDPYKSFTDFQEKGPYKSWIHFHEFIPNKEGVLMRDTVDYELSFGVLGMFIHRLFVKKKIENIFDYRYRIVQNLFNSVKN